VGAYVELGDYADLEIAASTDFGLCGWVYLVKYPGFNGVGTWLKGYLYCKGYNTGAAASAFHISVGTTGLITASIGEGTEASTVSMATGAWNFIWLRRTSGLVEMGWSSAAAGLFNVLPFVSYVDTTSAGVNAQKGTFLAKSDASGDDYLIAKIDQFDFANGHAFTDVELTGMYNDGTGTEALLPTGRANRVYFSNQSTFVAYDATNYFDVPTNNKQQENTLLGAYYDTLIVGLNNELWTFFGTGGNPATDWSLKKSNSPVGPCKYSPWVVIDGLFWFIASDGKLWIFDGNTSYMASEKMNLTLNTGEQTMSCLNGNLYGIYSGGVYSYDATRKVFRKSNYGINCLNTDGIYLFGGASASGKVYRLEETDLFGTAGDIDSYWTTRWFDFGMPQRAKTIFDVFIYCEEQSHAGTLNVSLYKDYSSSAVTTFNVNQQAASNPRNGQRLMAGLTGIRGNHWQLKLGNATASQPYEVSKVVVRYLEEDDQT
jgi:hypothetical protein